MIVSVARRRIGGPPRRWSGVALSMLLAGLLAAPPAAAIDLSWSAFGTVGYAISNQPYKYQRFIDDDGTFKRDSVAGLQLDTKLTNEFAATVQVKIAADNGTDRRYEGSVSWAFLSYRPTNDLLIRVGKQRIPLYLFSETLDVGTTYDFARLPTEMYSLAPANDAISVSFNKTWKLGEGELSTDGFYGYSDNEFRNSFREGIPGVQDAGPLFTKLKFRGEGFSLAYRKDDDVVRLGVIRAHIRPANKAPLQSDFPFVSLAPGIGYYQVSDSLPGPGVRTESAVASTTITAGADVALPLDFRVLAEFARNTAARTNIAPQGNRGYVAVLKRVERWTPYVSYAFLRSPQGQRDLENRVNDNSIPAFIPGAALINASQVYGADAINVYHQTSWAFGTSLSFSATSKLKGEFLRTHVYDGSNLIDSPPGASIRNQAVNVYSISYSVVY